MPQPKRQQLGKGVRAARQFTDRQDARMAFQHALRKSPDEYRMLVYYGLGGIGKSRLCQELSNNLKANHADTIHATVDLSLPELRSMEAALGSLRATLRGAYGISFDSFDLAYAIYWQKVHPQIPLSQESFPYLEDGSVVADLLDVLAGITSVGQVTKLIKALETGWKRLKRWWSEGEYRSLQELPHKQPHEIQALLPVYFGLDLHNHLATAGGPSSSSIPTRRSGSM